MLGRLPTTTFFFYLSSNGDYERLALGKETLNSKTPRRAIVRGLVFSARFATVNTGAKYIHPCNERDLSMAQWVSFDEIKTQVSMTDLQ